MNITDTTILRSRDGCAGAEEGSSGGGKWVRKYGRKRELGREKGNVSGEGKWFCHRRVHLTW